MEQKNTPLRGCHTIPKSEKYRNIQSELTYIVDPWNREYPEDSSPTLTKTFPACLTSHPFRSLLF